MITFLVVFTAVSCSNDSLEQQKSTNTLISKVGIGFKKEVKSDFVSADNGCITVNIRIYYINMDTGERFLVANENALVGDCEEEEKPEGNSHCESGHLPNGDFVYSNGTTNPECLLNLLRNDEDLYKEYLISVNTLLGLER